MLKAMSAQQHYGGHSMVSELERVLVYRPESALAKADPHLWHYTSPISLDKAQQQHDELVAQLKKQQVEVIYHAYSNHQLADAIFVHDPILMTNAGAIILQMGKILRRGEEALLKKTLTKLNIPIVGELFGEATVEGGDLLWLNEHTLLVGSGFRTNEAGILQLRQLLTPLQVNLIDFDLPFFQGKEACLHLQSLISLISNECALVYLPLLPTALYQLLIKNKFTLIELPEEEFITMGGNVLAIKPNLVLALQGNPLTKKRLEAHGVEVLTYPGDELSLKTEGGPTCLTRPLKRKNA